MGVYVQLKLLVPADMKLVLVTDGGVDVPAAAAKAERTNISAEGNRQARREASRFILGGSPNVNTTKSSLRSGPQRQHDNLDFLIWHPSAYNSSRSFEGAKALPYLNMAPVKRVRPYKDFLTPNMHSRFAMATATLFGLCYVESVLIGQWDSCKY
jgi:hypothetical protein